MMRSSECVINTSPWIALSVCRQTQLLNKLYQNVFMPAAVEKEVMAGGKNETGIAELRKADWLQIMKIQDSTKLSLLHELDRGEAEVIILAQEQQICEVIIDEKIGRMQAHIAGLQVTGTLGLLLRAKKEGFLPKIKPLIEKILAAGIYVHQNIVQGILREADE